MPKTQQSPADRIGWNMRKLKKRTDQIMDSSPDSETKDQMKARMYRAETVMRGNRPGYADGGCVKPNGKHR
jgi:hypothetical protein